jgi:hypothetical protein
MEMHVHNVSHLFAQLGLPADDASISQFVTEHAPLANDKLSCHGNRA